MSQERYYFIPRISDIPALFLQHRPSDRPLTVTVCCLGLPHSCAKAIQAAVPIRVTYLFFVLLPMYAACSAVSADDVR